MMIRRRWTSEAPGDCAWLRGGRVPQCRAERPLSPATEGQACAGCALRSEHRNARCAHTPVTGWSMSQVDCETAVLRQVGRRDPAPAPLCRPERAHGAAVLGRLQPSVAGVLEPPTDVPACRRAHVARGCLCRSAAALAHAPAESQLKASEHRFGAFWSAFPRCPVSPYFALASQIRRCRAKPRGRGRVSNPGSGTHESPANRRVFVSVQLVGDITRRVESLCVDRAEAEAIYDAGREVVVEVLLRMDRRIQQLEARVEKLERELSRSSRNSSRPPSSDPPSSPARSKDRSGRGRGAQPGHELSRGERPSMTTLSAISAACSGALTAY